MVGGGGESRVTANAWLNRRAPSMASILRLQIAFRLLKCLFALAVSSQRKLRRQAGGPTRLRATAEGEGQERGVC
jgi:hypothetical protein